MKIYSFFTFFLISFLSFSVLAQENNNNICAYLEQVQSQESVNFTPSDYSDAVQEIADVNVSVIQPPEFIEFPLTVDLAQFINQLALPVGTLQESFIGSVKVYLDGRVLYNGEDIAKPVSSFCKEQEDESEVKLSEPKILDNEKIIKDDKILDQNKIIKQNQILNKDKILKEYKILNREKIIE